MRWPRIIFFSLILIILGAFFHYIVPQRDIVRIVGTEVIRTDLSGWNRIFYSHADMGAAAVDSRDVRFINAVRPSGSSSVYRNEDRLLFLKFDSQNLATEAADLVSTSDDPQWVIVWHYGWRSTLLSAYPNALRVTPVDSPDVQLWPWPALVVLLILGIILLILWRLWERFEDRVIEPVSDRTAVRFAKLRDRVSGRR